MAKLIVAFSDRQLTSRVSHALEAEGLSVFRACCTGNAVMQAFNICQDGVLICGTHFADRTADMLAWDLGKRVLILVVGRAEQLELCEHPDLHRLQAPFSKQELTARVNDLLREHANRLPHRSEQERRLIEEAKGILMREFGLTEKEAHQSMQKESMRCGIKMIEGARRIVEAHTAKEAARQGGCGPQA